MFKRNKRFNKKSKHRFNKINRKNLLTRGGFRL